MPFATVPPEVSLVISIDVRYEIYLNQITFLYIAEYCSKHKRDFGQSHTTVSRYLLTFDNNYDYRLIYPVPGLYSSTMDSLYSLPSSNLCTHLWWRFPYIESLDLTSIHLLNYILGLGSD